MEAARFSDAHRPQRGLAPDRQVAVGVGAVQALGEDALGDGGRHLPHLEEPVEAEIAHAVEVGGVQPRPDDHLGQQRQRRRRGPLERGEADEGRVRTDLGVELRAEPAERLVQRERIEVAAPFVEEVAGDRREPGRPAGSNEAPARTSTRTDMSGTSPCTAVHASRPFESRRRRISGNANDRLGPGGRQARSIHGHQDTETGFEPSRASDVAAVRHDAQRHTRRAQPSRRRSHQPRGVRPAIPRQVFVEVPGCPEVHVVGVQLIRLPAEAADGLQAVQEMRFGLCQAPLQLRRRRPFRMEPRQLACDGLFELGERAARRRGRDDLKEAAELARALRRRHLGRDALFVHQAAIQPRRLAAGQHLGHQIQLRVVFGEEGR